MAFALRNASPLKPEIRLAQALSEYETVLTPKRKAEFREYRRQRPPKAADVMTFTSKIDTGVHRNRNKGVGPRLYNVLQAVQQFSSVIDIIVGSSQSHLAGALWGVIKMTLMVASSFLSYFDKLSGLFMSIGRSCPRYQEFTDLFRDSGGLQRASCEYFVVVIGLCKEALVFLQKSFASQLSSSLLQPFESQYGHFERDLKRLSNEIREEILLALTKAQVVEAKESSKFRKFMSRSKLSQELEERQKIKGPMARWNFLNACSGYDHQRSWKQLRKAGSSSWIYEEDEYKEWLKPGSSSILWCTGIIGSGKSVLTANLVENLVASTAPSPTTVVSYFFCRYDDSDSVDVQDIIGSIVRQILEATPPEAFADIELSPTSLQADAAMGYLWALLPPDDDRDFFIVIDALDECSKLEELMQNLKEFLDSKYNFHIFCSCRTDACLGSTFEWEPQHHITMSADAELKQYIQSELEHRLESGSLKLGDPTLIVDIREALINGSQGMFLWVVFQLDSICTEESDKQIIRCLDSLPRDLPETYDRALRKLEQGRVKSELQKRLFQSICAAARPLTLEELREAMAIVPGDTTWRPERLVNDIQGALTRNCGSLVVADEEESTVRFAHHSVKQHLVSKGQAIADLRINISEATIFLGEVCVTYLNLDVFDNQLQQSKKAPPALVDVSRAIARNISQSRAITTAALKLLKANGTAKYVFHPRLEKATSRPPERPSFDYVFLSYAGDYWLVHAYAFESQGSHLFRRLVRDKGSTVKTPWKTSDDADGGHYTHPALCWAAGFGHKPLAKFLLDEPDTNADVKDKWGRTALSRAAEMGNEAILEWLLDRDDVDINSRDINERTPLLYAVERGQETVVRMLLKRTDIEADAQDHLDRTPFSYAIGLGLQATARLFLPRADVDVNNTDVYGRTPLVEATLSGRIAMVKLCLERKDVKTDLKDNLGRTPLSWATEVGNMEVAKLLTARSAEIDETRPSQTRHDRITE